MLLVAAALTVGAATAGPMSLPVRAEPLRDACTDPESQHHRSCEVGYLAMYIPHGPTADCGILYAREVNLHPNDRLLESDFVTGCEAAHRERIELGVTRGLDP